MMRMPASGLDLQITMSDEYHALIELRIGAKRLLESSSLWKGWRAANDALFASLSLAADYLTTSISPEAVVDGSDAPDCVFNGYAVLQHEQELRRQLLLSSEWRSLQGVDSDIKQFARRQLRNRPFQKQHSPPPWRIRASFFNAMSSSSDRGLDATSLDVPSPEPPSLLPPSSSLSLPSPSSSSSFDSASAPSHSSQPETTTLPPPPTELLVREVNEIAPLPDEELWNALCPGLAELEVVGTLADGSCGQSTACQALHITPWLRAPSRRSSSTNVTRRHPNSVTPTQQQLLSLNEQLSHWLSSMEGRLRWDDLCEQTRHLLPSVDLQSAEELLNEMKVLTTPVGLSWWMAVAEVHQLNVFILHMFTSSLWEPDSTDPTASLLVQIETQRACRLVSRAGRLVPSRERENCIAVLCQQVSSSWVDKTRKGTRNVAHYEVVVDHQGRSMWSTTCPVVSELLMSATRATEGCSAQMEAQLLADRP